MATNNTTSNGTGIPAEINNASFWSEDIITAVGGQYRLCWCAGTNYASTSTANESSTYLAAMYMCSISETFVVDAGTFTLVGPHPFSQDRTCVSGLSCSLDGLVGNHLMSSDLLTVLDTCGTHFVVPRFADKGRIAEVSNSGAVVSWGTVAISAAGGIYQICWCSGGV
jgi:hypothetical protein